MISATGADVIIKTVKIKVQNDKAFLFEQLGKEIELDYDAIIKASACVGNELFLIYKK